MLGLVLCDDALGICDSVVVYSLFVVTPSGSGDFVLCTYFCGRVLSILSSFAITLLYT